MKKSIGLAVGAALLAAWSALPAQAELDVQVFIRPDRDITDTDPVTLIIRVDGSDQVPAVKLPRLQNLRVISGPNTSTQIRSDFRTTVRVTTLSYTLLAERPGPAEIPAFDIRVGDETVRAEPIRFEVAEGAAGRPRPAPGRAPPSDEREQIDAFIEARLGVEEVWVGQPVSLSVTLFSARLVGFDWERVPSLAEFWVEEDEVNPEAESYRAEIGGRPYTAYPLFRRVLVPSSPGEYTIEPFVGQVRARISDGFFSFGRTVRAIRKSEPLPIRVKPLPQEGRPADFSGAVGTFEMTAALDRDEARVDEAVALQVTVAGEGFLKPVRAPRLDAPPDLKVFPPKPNERLTIRGGRMVSRKSWEWVLVPLAAGEMRVPGIRFSYFDPAAGRYRQLGGDPLLLAVRRGDGRGDRSLQAGGDIRVQRTDIAFIKARRGRLAEGRPRLHQQPGFLALALAPLVLGPLAVLVGRHRARLQRDRGLARARRARGRARKRLRATTRRAESMDRGTFHEEVARTLVDYMADRFNLASAGLTYDRLDDLLADRGLDAEVRGRFRSCLERCDFARFVPSAGRSESREQIIREATKLIEEIDRAL